MSGVFDLHFWRLSHGNLISTAHPVYTYLISFYVMLQHSYNDVQFWMNLGIVAFQAFVMSCFGQWRMSFHVENVYRELYHTYLVPDTLQSYSSLGFIYTAIVKWLADQLVCKYSG